MWLDYLLYLFGIVLKHTYWLCLCIWLPHSGNVNSPLFGLSVNPPVYEAKPLNRELPLSHFFRICYPFKWESQMASDGGVMCVVLGKLKKITHLKQGLFNHLLEGKVHPWCGASSRSFWGFYEPLCFHRRARSTLLNHVHQSLLDVRPGFGIIPFPNHHYALFQDRSAVVIQFTQISGVC